MAHTMLPDGHGGYHWSTVKLKTLYSRFYANISVTGGDIKSCVPIHLVIM